MAVAAPGAALPAAGAAAPTHQRLRRTAEKFEGILVARLLHEMQATRLGPDGLGGPGGSVYRGMLDNRFADSIASRDPFGIARLLVEQLGGAQPGAPASGPGPVRHALPARRTDGAPAAGTPGAGEVERARRFAGRVLPLLAPAARRLGTTPRALLAQAALETGWGRHMPRTKQGGDSHNVFGIKAGSEWRGRAAPAATSEHARAGWQRTTSDFRVYRDLRAAVSDFVRVAGRLTAGVKRSGLASPAGWGELMQRVGYATDPGYAAKISAIANGPLMRTVLGGSGAGVKSATDVPLNAIRQNGIDSHGAR